MPALTIDGTTVPIRADGGLVEGREDLGRVARSHAGFQRSDVTASRGRATFRTVETPPLETADATTVRDLLTPVGTVTVNGDRVGGSNFSAFVRDLSETPDRNGLSVFRFTLYNATT